MSRSYEHFFATLKPNSQARPENIENCFCQKCLRIFLYIYIPVNPFNFLKKHDNHCTLLCNLCDTVMHNDYNVCRNQPVQKRCLQRNALWEYWKSWMVFEKFCGGTLTVQNQWVEVFGDILICFCQNPTFKNTSLKI